MHHDVPNLLVLLVVVLGALATESAPVLHVLLNWQCTSAAPLAASVQLEVVAVGHGGVST